MLSLDDGTHRDRSRMGVAGVGEVDGSEYYWGDFPLE
jgi:hypothetical protein